MEADADPRAAARGRLETAVGVEQRPEHRPVLGHLSWVYFMLYSGFPY